LSTFFPGIDEKSSTSPECSIASVSAAVSACDNPRSQDAISHDAI
jgi:hypothetical protein